MKNKYPKSRRKHIRKEKARIRVEFSNLKKQEEAIKRLFDKVSGKLHVHPVSQSVPKPEKETVKPKITKTGKKNFVAKKPIEGKIKEEPAPAGISADKQKNEDK